MNRHGKAALWAAIGALLVLPLLLQSFGNHWVRIADTCLLYVMLALGMNIVVGYAGLLDLGYVAFYAVGAYMFGLLASPHLTDNFAWVASMFPAGLHTPWWITIPLGALLAALLGVLIGAPTLKLRGDYLAIVTLGFGEIVRLLIVNLGSPTNITNGAKGMGPSAFSAGTWASPEFLAAIHSPRSPCTTTCSWRSWCSPPPPAIACRTRGSVAPGWRSATTRWPLRPWASTSAT